MRIRTVLAALAASGGAAAAIVTAVPAATAQPAAAALSSGRAVIDHVAFEHLPRGLGQSSNFRYRFNRVDFTARVWESRSSGGWRVDLDIDVMRGARLSSGSALHDWFIGYEQRASHPHYLPVLVHGHPGWLCPDQLFWLMRPGLAVSVQIDGSRWATWSVVRTAKAAHLRR